MTNCNSAIAKARTRLEACVQDMDEDEGAKLLESVETAVLRFPSRRLGEATPYSMGTPEYEAFHAAVGPGIELPVDQQEYYHRQAATLLRVVADETREKGRMVDAGVTEIVKGIANGRRYDTRLPARLLKRVQDDLAVLLEAETDKARIAAAIASLVHTVRAADITPYRDACAIVSRVFAEMNPLVARCGAGAIYHALDGGTRNWLSTRMLAA